MIAKPTEAGCSLSPSFGLWEAFAGDASAAGFRSSPEKRHCWTQEFGGMMRAMSEFLMLATSRSPAQWMTLAAARESAAGTRAATASTGHRSFCVPGGRKSRKTEVPRPLAQTPSPGPR